MKPSIVNRPIKFSMRSLLIATAIIAVVLGVETAIESYAFDGQVRGILPALTISVGLFSLFGYFLNGKRGAILLGAVGLLAATIMLINFLGANSPKSGHNNVMHAKPGLRADFSACKIIGPAR